MCVVTWKGACAPGTEWKTYCHWRRRPAADRVERARVAALKEPRFFRRCVRCGELNNAGHMHDREICQSCAERFFGVVY